MESCIRCVSSQRLIRKRCEQCSQISKRATCPLCNDSGYFGRIGVHEVLDSKQLLESNPPLDIYSAGMKLVKAGLIDLTSLNSELGAWR
jgi:type II secretory ATPase GspE/PulE/Tfp pilus assembly ATPase PilB-like protein